MTRKGHFFMETYIEVLIESSGQEQSSFLIATLDKNGYTGFLEEINCLKAYIPAANFQPVVVAELCSSQDCSFSIKHIEPTNWNERWESSFHPVYVENFAVIRATFHAPVKEVTHEIIINPKMSFGTGHHATGTGILAILADKMGASYTLAIDNDRWSIENAKENLLLNHTAGVQLETAAYPPDNVQFDLILANINRSVLLKFIPTLSKNLSVAGSILISGFLKEDRDLLIQAAKDANLSMVTILHKDEWLSILFNKAGGG